MKATKWYTLLTLAVALLLFSGATNATHSQASGSRPDSVTPTPTECIPSWGVVSSPNVGNSSQLYGVATISTSDVWAVGDSRDTSNHTSTLTEHWNGATWSIVSSPISGTSSSLQGVAATSPGDVWAVGYYIDSTTGYDGRLIEHWDGSSWSIVSAPSPGLSSFFYGVTALSSSDVWAVGAYVPSVGVVSTLVEHWDGTSWSVVASPNPSVGTYSPLQSVAAISPNDVWAVGYASISGSGYQTLAEHWNGASWSIIPSPNAGTHSVLYGVATISSSDVWAVGDDSTNTLTEHWNGSTWGVAPSPGTAQLAGVAAISSSDVWAVGGSFAGATQIEHWDGASWRVVPNPSTGILHGTSALSSSDVWAVGSATTGTLVEHYSAACGTPMPSPTICPVPFTDITGNVFYNAIAYLYCRGALNGTDATHYSPALTTTRAQFAKVVVLAFSLPSYTPNSGQDFTDVPIGYFAYGYIETGFHAGILGGYDANTCAAHNAAFPCYLPNLPITRGQVTKLIVSAAHYALLTPTGGNPTFTDVPPQSVFFVSIETAHAHGVINGYPDGSFRPNNNVRRDEMAQIVFKGLTSP